MPTLEVPPPELVPELLQPPPYEPATVTPNGGPVTTTLTVTTMAPSIHSRLHEPSNWLLAQGGTFAIAVFLVPGVLRRNGNRRKKFAVTMMLLVIVSLISLVEQSAYTPFLSCSNSAGGTISSVYPQSRQTGIFWMT